MYLEYYGLQEAPFRITPHTDFFFSGANRGETLEALIYAVTHDEGIVKISGEVGSGKTMLCRVLMERLPDHVVTIYLANPSLSREDILYALADELGLQLPEQSRNTMVLRALQERLVELYGEGKQVVVLIDEAHAMPIETLEEIRLLSNLESNRHKLLQLVLFGQPEINEILARTDMRQLRDRITQNFVLEPLVRDDIAAYLDFRMRAAGYRGPSVFSPEAIKLISAASQGLTRRINILADKALLAAFAGNVHLVGKLETKAAIRDSEFVTVQQPVRSVGQRAGLLGLLAGALVAGLAVWAVMERGRSGGALPAAVDTRTTVQPAISSGAVVQADAPSGPAVVQPASSHHPVVSQSAEVPREAVPRPHGSRTPLLDALVADSRPWLESVADNRWFVQLYRAQDMVPSAEVERFIVAVRTSGLDTPNLRAYRIRMGNVERFGIIYGDYDSRKLAAAAIAGMPEAVLKYQPYPRAVIKLRPGRGE